jgi:hypothetical protein
MSKITTILNKLASYKLTILDDEYILQRNETIFIFYYDKLTVRYITNNSTYEVRCNTFENFIEGILSLLVDYGKEYYVVQYIKEKIFKKID